MNRLKPIHLSRGETIGVIAPSYPFPSPQSGTYYDWFSKGKKELEVMGFKVKLGKNIDKVRWWTGGTPKERAEDINLMFADKEVKAIITHDGGHSAITTLEYIDFKLIKNNPKPFMGFSDITNFHCAFYTKTGLTGFHMDLLSYGLGWVWQEVMPEKKDQARKLFFEILTSTKPLGIINPFSVWECWRQGQAQGKLFGGSLSLLGSLIGTEYFPQKEDLKGTILFWEADDCPTYRIERILYQMKYSGILDNISGMIIGKLVGITKTGWEGLEQPTPKDLILETLKDYDFPILANVDFGHKTVQIPMPLGLLVKFDAEKLRLEFLESATI